MISSIWLQQNSQLGLATLPTRPHASKAIPTCTARTERTAQQAFCFMRDSAYLMALDPLWLMLSYTDQLQLRQTCSSLEHALISPLQACERKQFRHYTLSKKLCGGLSQRAAIAVLEKMAQQDPTVIATLLHKEQILQPLPLLIKIALVQLNDFTLSSANTSADALPPLPESDCAGDHLLRCAQIVPTLIAARNSRSRRDPVPIEMALSCSITAAIRLGATAASYYARPLPTVQRLYLITLALMQKDARALRQFIADHYDLSLSTAVLSDLLQEEQGRYTTAQFMVISKQLLKKSTFSNLDGLIVRRRQILAQSGDSISLQKENNLLAQHFYARAQKLFPMPYNLTKAAALYRSCVEFNPQHVAALYGELQCLIECKNWAATLPIYQRVLQIAPQHVAAMHLQALSHLQQGQWTAVVDVCQQLLKIQPQHIAGRQLLGSAYIQQSDWPAALHTFEQLLNYDAKHAQAIYGKAICLFYQGTTVALLQFLRPNLKAVLKMHWLAA